MIWILLRVESRKGLFVSSDRVMTLSGDLLSGSDLIRVEDDFCGTKLSMSESCIDDGDSFLKSANTKTALAGVEALESRFVLGDLLDRSKSLLLVVKLAGFGARDPDNSRLIETPRDPSNFVRFAAKLAGAGERELDLSISTKASGDASKFLRLGGRLLDANLGSCDVLDVGVLAAVDAPEKFPLSSVVYPVLIESLLGSE